MPRISRKCYDSSFFHVMIQGINKEFIFNQGSYKQRFLKYLLDGVSKFDVDLIAYCIMDNHVHLLLHTSEISNLSKLMQSVNTRYAKFYNKCSNRCGFVFRDRYRCENIMTQNHLESCVRYIHNNPVNANMCTKPYQYKYSSYLDYKNKKIDPKIFELLSWDENNYNDKLDGIEKDYHFIDDTIEYWDELKKEKLDNVLLEFMNIEKCTPKELYSIICDIKKRCNIDNKEIIEKMQISESKFYRIMRKFKK